jgi:preprotein translocase subunit SecD
MLKSNQRNLILIAFILAIALWIVWPDNPGIHIGNFEKEIETRLGLDLVGGVSALLEADLPAGTSVDPEAMRTAVRIVENRVNGLGVTESVVQQAGDRRVVVELPGETDPEKALSILKQTGLLEFVDFSDLTQQDFLLLGESTIKTDFAMEDKQLPSIEPTPGQEQSEESTSSVSPIEDRVFNTVMTGADLKSVQVVTGPTGEYQVSFELTPNGSSIFSDFTTNNIGKMLAIVLDKGIISAPIINDAITDGRGVITGNFDYESANALAIQLRYGSLPIPLKVVETTTVGPTLGQDSLQKSLIAGVIGFSIVILFMGLYYRLPGFVADISIIIYAVFAFALFRFIPITLTLPGVAGFLLSTGSALDANILVFERIKEELRAGKPLQQSINLGWKRAWPSIRDSNIAILITCGILFWFGSAFGATIVKGFSITLALGIIISVFTALIVTRALLILVLGFFKPTNYPKWFGI